MKPCEIAVIVPVYNAAAYLTACTDAIAAQKFDGFRCILVDDGSTDGSPALCDAIAAGDQRFVALHQPNSGVCAARTAGLRQGRALGARWFAFCDADDLYHPDLLDTLYAAVTNSGLPLACCRYDTFADTPPADAAAPENCRILARPGPSGRAAARPCGGLRPVEQALRCRSSARGYAGQRPCLQ